MLIYDVKDVTLRRHERFTLDIENFTLAAGDRILLVSDGYLEQLSPTGEMLDPERCRRYFQEAADRPSDEVIEHLLARFDDWRGATPQGDDVTLVVLEAAGA